MKLVTLTIGSLVLAASLLSAKAGDITPVSLGEAMANRNCAWCHGAAGKGFSTAPRLAGQTRQYIENQLMEFRAHSRDNPKSQQYMWGATSPIEPTSAHELATYFASLASEPANDGDANLVASGRATYKDGMPDANIPSCIACHGPNAEGVGSIPRLAGLSHRYLKRRLQQWGQGYHASAQPPMAEIAKNLPPNEIDALASFLSFEK